MTVEHETYRDHPGSVILASLLTRYIIDWNDGGLHLPNILNVDDPITIIPPAWKKDGQKYPGWIGIGDTGLEATDKIIKGDDVLIHVGSVPPICNVITFLDFSAKAPQLTANREINPPYDYHGVQVSVYHKSYKIGIDWSNKIKLLLHGFVGLDFMLTRDFDFISSIMCTIPPAFFDKTEQLGFRIVTSFEVQTN